MSNQLAYTRLATGLLSSLYNIDQDSTDYIDSVNKKLAAIIECFSDVERAVIKGIDDANKLQREQHNRSAIG